MCIRWLILVLDSWLTYWWRLRARFCEPVLDIPRGLPLNKMILHYRDYHVRAASSCRGRALPLYRGDNQKKEFSVPPPGRGSSYGGGAREYRNEVLQRDGDEIRPFRYQRGQDTVRGCRRTITVQILRMHAQ